MPSPLSTWALGISPSPTLAIDAKAKVMLAAGEDVLNFAAGEPDFDTPEHIKEAAITALRAGKTKYAPTPGIAPLREAIAAKYAEDYGLAVAPSQVIVSPGGKFSCYLAVLAVCSPGDEAIIPAPYWVSYPEMVKLAGAVPEIRPGRRRDRLSSDRGADRGRHHQKDEAPDPEFPVEPDGRGLSARRNGGDRRGRPEAQSHDPLRRNLRAPALRWGEARRARDPQPRSGGQHHHRLGFFQDLLHDGLAPGHDRRAAALAKAVGELQSQMSSNATTFAQYGALAALKEKALTQASLQAMLTAFDRRRQFLHRELTRIPGVTCVLAQGAFYLFPNISKFGIKSEEFCARLLEKEKVAAVPGSGFGAEGYMRLSYATSDEVIARGVERIARFCQTL